MNKYVLTKEELDFFTSLYKTHYKELCKYVSIIARNRLSCEDIVQDVFVIVMDKIQIVKSHPSPDKWLYVTAKNVAWNALKKRMDTKEIPTLIEDMDLAVEDNTEMDFLFSDLERVLTKEEVYVLKKHFVEGFSIKEISKQIATNPGSTRMKFSRIYKKVRNSKIFPVLVLLFLLTNQCYR